MNKNLTIKTLLASGALTEAQAKEFKKQYARVKSLAKLQRLEEKLARANVSVERNSRLLDNLGFKLSHADSKKETARINDEMNKVEQILKHAKEEYDTIYGEMDSLFINERLEELTEYYNGGEDSEYGFDAIKMCVYKDIEIPESVENAIALICDEMLDGNTKSEGIKSAVQERIDEIDVEKLKEDLASLPDEDDIDWCLIPCGFDDAAGDFVFFKEGEQAKVLSGVGLYDMLGNNVLRFMSKNGISLPRHQIADFSFYIRKLLMNAEKIQELDKISFRVQEHYKA